MAVQKEHSMCDKRFEHTTGYRDQSKQKSTTYARINITSKQTLSDYRGSKKHNALSVYTNSILL